MFAISNSAEVGGRAEGDFSQFLKCLKVIPLTDFYIRLEV